MNSEYEEARNFAKKKIEESSKGIDNDYILWMKNRIIEEHPHWKNFEDKDKFEYYVFDELARFLKLINHDKPSDIHSYVERQLKRQSYEKGYEVLENEIRNMKPYDEERGKEIRAKYDALISKIQAEDPEFWEERKRRFHHTLFLLGAKLAGDYDRIEQ